MNTLQENTSGCDAQEWRTNRMHWGCLGSKMGPIFKMSHNKPLWPKTAICPRSKWGLRENFTIFDIVFAKSTCQDGFGEWPLFSFFWWDSWGSFCGEVYCGAVSPTSTCFQVISSRSCICGDKFGCNLKQVDSKKTLTIDIIVFFIFLSCFHQFLQASSSRWRNGYFLFLS